MSKVVMTADGLVVADLDLLERFDTDSVEESVAGLRRAELLRRLSLQPEYHELLKVLDENLEGAKSNEFLYRGRDLEKIGVLRQRRLEAEATLDFVRNTVEAAVEILTKK